MAMRSRQVVVVCALSSLLAGSLIALAAADDQAPVAEPQALVRPALARPAQRRPRDLLAGLDPLRHEQVAAGFVATLDHGLRAELTLDTTLQARAEKVLRDYQVPYGALVAIEPSTGRVLAYVSRSYANPNAGDLARDPTPPAASVFKVITAAALVDAGVGPDARACYGGGLSRLSALDLADDPRRDRSCATLAQALGGSINAVIAKLSDRHLDGATLRRYADAFGFAQKLPFDVDVAPSPSEVPEERLERARTAAGFWHMHMSPLHGALIAATIANGGVMPRASMVSRVVDAQGKLVHGHKPEAFRAVLSAKTARTVSRMMLRTVEDGTSHSAFFDPRGRPYLPGISVAGKTGSLSADEPYRAYSWWVGFAPEDKPAIALAALVVNTPKWRIKSSYVAREALRAYLVERAAGSVIRAPVAQSPR